jgi:hypothetical protein
VKCEKISDDLREAFEERAAIVEDGCKVSRAELDIALRRKGILW